MSFRMGLIGRKLGNTQIFADDGTRIPVTIVELGPNTVVQKKTKDTKDGYGAIQIGFKEKEHRKIGKPLSGHFKRANVKPCWVLKELRVPDDKKLEEFQVGQELKADVFSEGDWVDVSGTSKGKGMQGVMVRWNMKGSKQKTHGTHEVQRHPGSIGTRTTPGRVNRGKHLPGHMGHEKVTIQNLKIVKIDTENNIALIRGSIPGPVNGFVVVRQAVKKLNKQAAA